MKNNVFARLLWGLYAVTAGGLFLLVMLGMLFPLGYGLGAVLAVSAALSALTGLIVFCTKKLLFRIRQAKECNDRKPVTDRGNLLLQITESLLVLLCLAGIAALRLPGVSRADTNPYFEAAAVTMEELPISVGHSGAVCYIWFLHFVLIFFGNKIVAAAASQLALQLAAVFCTYCAVRRLSGRLPAFIVLVIWCTSPYMLDTVGDMTPLALFLTVFGLAVWTTGGMWKHWETDREEHPAGVLLRYAAIGILTGACCCLDAAGGLAIIFLLRAVFFGRKQEQSEGQEIPDGFWNNRLFVCLFCLASELATFLAAHALLGFLTGGGFLDSLTCYAQQLVPGFFRLPFFVEAQGRLWDVFVLVFLLMAGIFSFSENGIRRGCGVWLAAGVTLAAMQCFQLAGAEPVNSYALLYLFAAAVAGNVVSAVFCTVPAGKAKEDGMLSAGKAQSEMSPSDGKAADSEEGDIEFIYNPLPLPVKKQKKALDFDFDVADDDDFDIP